MPRANAASLIDLAEQLGVDAVYVEKDFVLTEIIHHYALGPYAERLVLKGGQALRHVYGSPRLSKDVDYVSERRIEFSDLVSELELTRPRLRLPSSPAGRTTNGIRVDPIGYRGPLGQLDNVELEVSFRGDLVLSARRLPYQSPFREPFSVLVMDISEMMTEKIRAMYQRGNPRDLFDLWYVFSHPEIQVDEAAILRTLPEKFRPPLVKGGWDRSRLYKRMLQEKGTWDVALDLLVPDHPTFDAALSAVERFLRFLPS